MERDDLLNSGQPAWWFVRDFTKAHLAADMSGVTAHPPFVTFRCGLVVKTSRLERPWDRHDTAYMDPEPKCRGCSQKGTIR